MNLNSVSNASCARQSGGKSKKYLGWRKQIKNTTKNLKTRKLIKNVEKHDKKYIKQLQNDVKYSKKSNIFSKIAPGTPQDRRRTAQGLPTSSKQSAEGHPQSIQDHPKSTTRAPAEWILDPRGVWQSPWRATGSMNAIEPDASEVPVSSSSGVLRSSSSCVQIVKLMKILLVTEILQTTTPWTSGKSTK